MPKPLRPNQATKEIGTSGTIIFGGFLSNTDYNLNLTGPQGIAIYDQMRHGDATVKAALLAVKLPILSAEWRMDPASEDQADKDIADWVWDQLNGMSRTFHDMQRESLNFL